MKTVVSYLLLLFLPFSVYGQYSYICLDCHGDKDLHIIKNGKYLSLFVDENKLTQSVHFKLDCNECHKNYDPFNLPHIPESKKTEINCIECHKEETWGMTEHGQKNVKCYDCHSKHYTQQAKKLLTVETDFCLSCHKRTTARNYINSIHFAPISESEEQVKCLDCHDKFAHKVSSAKFSEDKLHQVCANCHESVVLQYEQSLHGKALAHGKFLAPNCITCHNKHNILNHKDPSAKTFKMNVPNLCGQCHKEGTKVSELKEISQRNVLANYSQSIHGEGLFKRGLIVTAVCNDCHKSHNILPHQDPKSSINRNNIATTCQQCHAQIEEVHVKVIEGQLWEKEPHKIPACVDCHQPHKVRRVVYEEIYTNDYCMACHDDMNLQYNVNGQNRSLYVDIIEFDHSVHKDNACVKCHSNINIGNSPVCKDSGPVDCAACHAEIVTEYQTSKHGTLFAKNDENAPYCNDCHGTHEVLSKKDLRSRTFRTNIPKLCADCHREGEEAAKRYKGEEHNIIENYSMSIHGKGLIKSGLVVTATCIDCHTSHGELPASDPRSTVYKDNIPNTCAQCHLGVFAEFKQSVHSPTVTKTDKDLPSCYDCHKSHDIQRVDQMDFRQGITSRCGRCHEDVTESYFETFHGKVSKLGEAKAAKCYDCHGSHNILPPENPNSTLSYVNVVQTCEKCHPGSNKQFVGYLTHANHYDKEKYPYLYYTFLFMTILLVGTFAFFWIHTLLWLPRALIEKRQIKNKNNSNETEETDKNKS